MRPGDRGNGQILDDVACVTKNAQEGFWLHNSVLSEFRGEAWGSSGNGCFWHTQYDFVVLEQHPAGPFRRNDTEVTSLVGYAGGRLNLRLAEFGIPMCWRLVVLAERRLLPGFQSPSGAVCYHGWPGTDYSRLGVWFLK